MVTWMKRKQRMIIKSVLTSNSEGIEGQTQFQMTLRVAAKYRVMFNSNEGRSFQLGRGGKKL
jgi:hypothetical protein